jgi:hypothetical protein
VEHNENEWDSEKQEIATTAAGEMKKCKEERELDRIVASQSRQSVSMESNPLLRVRGNSVATLSMKDYERNSFCFGFS